MRKMHLIGIVLTVLALGACSTEQMVGTGAGIYAAKRFRERYGA